MKRTSYVIWGVRLNSNWTLSADFASEHWQALGGIEIILFLLFYQIYIHSMEKCLGKVFLSKNLMIIFKGASILSHLKIDYITHTQAIWMHWHYLNILNTHRQSQFLKDISSLVYLWVMCSPPILDTSIILSTLTMENKPKAKQNKSRTKIIILWKSIKHRNVEKSSS